jgi:hypothetical protein
MAFVVLLVPFALSLGKGDRGTLVAFLATTGMTLLVSPTQDHVRRMLHIAGRSWSAALISACQLVAIVVALIAFQLTGIAAAWIPFSALGVANVASLSLGVLLVGLPQQARSFESVRAIDLFESGRWLFVADFIPQAASLAAASLIAFLAGTDELGFAEAARVVAQPVVVASMGIGAVVNPHAMEAGARGLRASGSKVTKVHMSLIASLGTAYVLVAGFDWVGNPLATLIPTAYAVGWLVPLSIAANMINGLSPPLRGQLIGGLREVSITRIEAMSVTPQLAVAGTAGVLGAFALPAGSLSLGLVRLMMFWRVTDRMYTKVGLSTLD